MRFTILTLFVFFLYLNSAFPQSRTAEPLLKRLLDLPAPAPGGPPPTTDAATPERASEFYRWKNMPADDAPLEDLLAYWKAKRYEPSQISYRRPMSERTAERLLDHFKENPAQIGDYLGGFPTDKATADRIREIHRSLLAEEGSEDRGQAPLLGRWLTNNTPDGVTELSKTVRKIRDRNDYVSNENQVALRSLAKLDWDAARPHVERLEFDGSNPHSQILAYWARYSHALAVNDSTDTETYRSKLQKVVEDRSARWSQRDLAMDALVDGGDWDGRDTWYISLFADETLLAIQENGNTGMTTLLNASATDEEWIDRFLMMVKSDNKAVRSAAARNLMHIYTDEKSIIEALLPWVSDPTWAKPSRTSERRSLIEALGEHDIAGAIPALITVLSNEQDDDWSAAVTALARRKDPRTAGTLRSLLSKTSGEVRQLVIDALVACGALSADEQMTDVEAYAVMSSTEDGREAIEREAYREYAGEDEEEGPISTKTPGVSIEVIIGKALADADEPSEGLATRAIERAKFLRKRNPEVSIRLAEIINGWKGRPIYLEQVRGLRTGEADLDNILSLLAERSEVREKIPNELASLGSASGAVRAIGACLQESDSEFLSIIGGNDIESQVAMLGCARLLRAKLPVSEIGRMLNHPNALLKLAAERYLESEDSLEARRLVLAKHPGEARLLGAHAAFVPDPKKLETSSMLQTLFQTVNTRSYASLQPNLREFESKLQTEIKEEKKLIAIFARLPEDRSGQQVVRVYKDKVEYTFYDDTARSWSRELTEKEYKDLYNSILANKIDALPPTLQGCDHGCPSFEFILLGRDGGRRIFTAGYQPGPELRAVGEHFESFKTKGDLKLSYRLAEKINGLEVLLADSKFPVHAGWKRGDDLRLLVSDTALAETIEKELAEKFKTEREADIEDDDEDEEVSRRAQIFQRQQQLRVEAIGKELSWRTLEKGKVGAVVEQPTEINLLPMLGKMPAAYRWNFFRSFDARTVYGGIYANRYQGGLFRAQESGEPVLIRQGSYENAVVAPDKRWVAVTKFTGKDQLKTLVRVNLQTGQEFPVNLPTTDALQPIAFVPSHGMVLVYSGPTRSDAESDPTSEGEPYRADIVVKAKSAVSSAPQYYLVDLARGVVKPVKGDFRPIEERSYRLPQSSSTAGAVWVAIYDPVAKSTEVGLYTEKSFSFVPVRTLPEIRLRSSDIWVSEDENKLLFVYQGHLLAVPLRNP